ncbi:MFS transporter [Dehalococcoides mccartyi]|uniref:Conserved hypothetical membrane protein n=1 Tax=Dehalococcoides mccartyi (strain CBDB1) TaxID=255470 RepID=A0A916KMF4_DEHMC|nr:MFS transporter [Dehalococcoides mccartyi]AQW62445.1 MFS transporter [Dehalococcoides mccartyi]CAI83001.1 conserved hypothetical membrane protein [Dehalococcoides mccartyi CBDB1]
MKTITRKSLDNSIKDGAAYSAMLGLTQDYITPFALALKASVPQIGILSALPNLSVALSQLFAPFLSEKAKSRKSFVFKAVLLQAVCFLPAFVLPLLFRDFGVWWLILWYTLGTMFGSLGNPAWSSLMADLVPGSIRGRFFGYRGMIAGIMTLAFSLASGLLLQISTDTLFLGFGLIFFGASLARFISSFFLNKMEDPQAKAPIKDGVSMKALVKDLNKTPMGKFISYSALINFSTYIAAPFFAVYMLRELGFDYLTYIIVISSASVANFVFMKVWGRICDICGNVKILKLCSVFVPVVPLLWIFSHNTYYLIGVQALSGIIWAGFLLSGTNYIFESSNRRNRMRGFALYTGGNSLGIALGSLVGGLLVSVLPQLNGYHMLSLFLVSVIARTLVVGLFINSIKELKPAGSAIPQAFVSAYRLDIFALKFRAILQAVLQLPRIFRQPLRSGMVIRIFQLIIRF